ncbi:MAG: single-stranded-DNA-specific exonuclease RecJ [Paludibacteraceae bacterium]|nr:single-stranded-DNA-specific exonuclease RecJ [Paludibacteraceae bacterium]
MQNQWIIKRLSPEEEEKQNFIANALGISPVMAKLLVQRGISTFDEAKAFFRPELSQLHDPFLIKDMDKAVERLNKALQKKENILIYGDYDVDGTTAVALVYKFLQNYVLPSQLDYYIPDRYKEGYGLSKEGIDYASEHNVKLVITLDCGIKAIERVEYAKSLGIDVIICDHHTTDDTLPRAIAVLDSKRADDDYPYKHLSGCGVGFKFMQAFAQNNGIDFVHLEQLLDFVAVSIASDIVPITGENRILAHYGIKRLNEHPSKGLQAIIDVCGLSNKQDHKNNHPTDITINDIVFKIGPRINASGRMKSGHEVVELLVSNDDLQAHKISSNINSYNEERKDIDKTTTAEAEKIITERGDIEKKRTIVVYNSDWHKGIVGIVASRLTEKYYKPTIVLTKANGLVSGSARSVHGFDLYKAIDSCRDILENFGGHTYAAGLSLKEENLGEFTARFEKYVSENIKESQLTPQIEIDSVLKFAEITPKFIRILRQFEPFGPGNSRPVFCTRRVFDYNGSSKIVGKGNEHLKLELTDDSSENVMNGIAFRMASFCQDLKVFNPLDIVFTLEDNTFNGATNTQLMIRDIKVGKL